MKDKVLIKYCGLDFDRQFLTNKLNVIKNHINDKALRGSCAIISDIKDTDGRYIAVTIDHTSDINTHLTEYYSAFIQGLVSGVLLERGVEVI